MPKDLITIKQVAEKYNISNRTLYYWITNNKIQSHRIGRKHFISESDLFLISGGVNAK